MQEIDFGKKYRFSRASGKSDCKEDYKYREKLYDKSFYISKCGTRIWLSGPIIARIISLRKGNEENV